MQLVRVRHEPQPADAALLGEVDPDDRSRHAVQAPDEAWAAADVLHPERDPWRLAQDAEDEAGDLVGSDDGPQGGPHFSSAVGGRGHVHFEEPHERVQIAGLTGVLERRHDVPVP
ncbi:hypothetical protein [Actinacidiphila glaucinigra]|uniref:hypothetical protein n=1 Tax=Actinacidiphila glaucinigra TaxID=235986 RepID=UPI0036E6A0F7